MVCIPNEVFYTIYLLAVTFLITNNVASVSTIPKGRRTNAFCTNPAIKYITNEIAATVIAYGNCVETC